MNLILFHPIAPAGHLGANRRLKGAFVEAVDRFVKQLRNTDIPVFIRYSAGVHIDAACGQLAVKNEAA